METKHSIISIYRPLILLAIFLFLTIILLCDQFFSCFSLLPFVGAAINLWVLIRNSIRYAFGRFIVTSRRIQFRGPGATVDLLLKQIEEIELLTQTFFLIPLPYPLTKKIIRVHAIGGIVATFDDVESDEEIQALIETLNTKVGS